MHRFWGCQHSVMFWELLREQVGLVLEEPPRHIQTQRALASWLLDWFARAEDDEKEVMLQAAYSFWLARNEARDGRNIVLAHEITATVQMHVAEWRASHETEGVTIGAKDYSAMGTSRSWMGKDQLRRRGLQARGERRRWSGSSRSPSGVSR